MAAKREDPRQRVAFVALLAGATSEEAAQAAGVSVGLINSWKRKDSFQGELRKSMERIRQEIEANFYLRIRRSFSTIDLMQSATLPNGDPNLEVRAEAAKLMLGNGARLLARYKEHVVEGYEPPPLFILPAGTRISTVRTIPEAPPQPKLGPIIEAEGHTVPDEDPAPRR